MADRIPGASVPRTHGRAAEQEAGELLLRQVAARGSILLVEGPPGAGKTHLLRGWSESALRAGYRVERAGGHELEPDRPFGVVREALGIDRGKDSERIAIHRLLSVRGAVDRGGTLGGLQYQVVEAMSGLVETWATAAPLLLVLDDLHWADGASLAVVGRLIRLAAVLPIGIIGAFRPAPRGPELKALAAAAQKAAGRHIVLSPLAPDAVAELVGDLAGGVPGGRLLAQAQRCGGSPLFIRELVAALGREGLLERSRDVVDLGGSDVGAPPDFSILVLRHVSLLPDPTLNTIRLASVLGSAFRIADLSLVMGRPVSDLVLELRPALDAGLLTAAGPDLAFQHDLVRDAVYGDLGEAVRSGLHEQVARALAKAGRSPLEVAPHFVAAATGPSAIAAAWLHRAAREAAPRDPSAAVMLLENARRLADKDVVLADRIELMLGLALTAAGRLRDGEAALRNAPLHAEAGRIRSLRRAALAQNLHLQARFEEAAQELESAAAATDLPGPVRARLFAHATMDRAWSGDVDGAEKDLPRARQGALKSGDRLAQFYVAMADASTCSARGRIGEAVEHSLEAGRLATVDESDEQLTHHEMPPVSFLIDADRFDEAENLLNTAPAWRAERGGAVQPMRHYQQLRCHFYGGRWDDAVVEGRLALSQSEASGTSWIRSQTLSFLLLIALHREERRAAATYARQLGNERDPGTFGSTVLAVAEAAGGDRERTRRALEPLRPLVVTFDVAAARDTGVMLARLHLAAGDRRSARAVAQHMQAAARAAGAGSVAAAALLCQGLADGAAEALTAAAAALRSTPRLVDLAIACEEAGRASGSVALLQEALALYEGFGAWRDAARTVAHLRACGVKPGRRGFRRRPATGWGSLTASERRVAELVAGGLLYREIAARLFISRRTVESHVVHLFGKLGVGSRRELERLVREELGQDPE